ncbi:MAG: hypothetical protein IKM35_04865 [Bacteroidaceae bacterium]|nr:hypothetical protein [Bacteroidaceae bacterium]
MKSITHILYVILVALWCSATVACRPDNDTKGTFTLSCGNNLNMVEGENEIIMVNGADVFTISTDNDKAKCVKNDNNTITVTAMKLGDCTLTISRNDGEKLTCTITIGKSVAQKDFEIISKPRVENWMPETVYTATTPALQVTFETGIDAAGRRIEGTTTLGFYFTDVYASYTTEAGAYCRLSAKSDFTQRGTLSDGMVAIYTPGQPVKHYMCEKVEIVNILNDQLWIVASIPGRPDLRIVTEVF